MEDYIEKCNHNMPYKPIQNGPNIILDNGKKIQKRQEENASCGSIVFSYNDRYISLNNKRTKIKIKLDIPCSSDDSSSQDKKTTMSVDQIKIDILGLTKCKKDCHICKILGNLNE